MGRTLRSAKRAGAKHEADVAAYLNSKLPTRVERRVMGGSLDRGDIAGVEAHGQEIAVECKNVSRVALSQWIAEAHKEAKNCEALCGIVVHKRHGKGDPGKQWVTMTLEDLVAVITGEPQPGRYEP